MVFRELETPRLDTNQPKTPAHIEAHTQKFVEQSAELIEPTRKSICDKYDIPNSNCFIQPVENGVQRQVRAFSIIQNKKNPQEIYYAEGNVPHAYLINDIAHNVKQFPSRAQIQDSFDGFDHDWFHRKGFIDPNANGFNDYPAIKSGLMRTQTIEEGEDIPTTVLQNWFLSGSSYPSSPPLS